MDLSQLGVSSGYKNRILFTASGSWTVPAGVYEIEAWATGAGSGGQGSSSFLEHPGVGGGAGSTSIRKKYPVVPGQVLTITIGAGGVGGLGVSGNLPRAAGAGGNTVVRIGNIPIAIGVGGGGVRTSENDGFLQQLITKSGAAIGDSPVRNGKGGIEQKNNSGTIVPATGGGAPVLGVADLEIANYGDASIGGVAGTASQRFGGGGGGNTIYGRGAHGADGGGTGNAVAASAAPSTSYGAGGGGASSSTNGTFANGSPGVNGIAEIWF